MIVLVYFLIVYGKLAAGLQCSYYSISCCLFSLFCSFFNILFSFSSAGLQCTEGFMEYDLLVQKASQIADGRSNSAPTRLGSALVGRQYVMQDSKFSCSGTIYSFLLGVEVRIDSNRDMSPFVSLFEEVDSTTYTLVAGTTRTIYLGAENFSSSGVFEFELLEPLEFQRNQFLGVFQPLDGDSLVRFYYQGFSGQTIYAVNDQGGMTYSRRTGLFAGHRSNARVLLTPVTSELKIHYD